MIEAFSWVINTYGKSTTSHKADGTELSSVQAIIQPMSKSDWQYTAGKLGEYQADSYLALSEPTIVLDDPWTGDYLQCDDIRYDIMEVRPIWVGGEVTHMWMALKIHSD